MYHIYQNGGFLNIRLISYVRGYLAGMHVCALYVPGACRAQKMELEVVVSHHMGAGK